MSEPKKKKKVPSPEFKAKVGLGAVRGLKTFKLDVQVFRLE